MSQKPATSSLVSENGPSTTVRVAPENLTRAPLELGCRPSPARSTPAFTSSSLNFPISVSRRSLGITPASLASLALTIIMNSLDVSPGSGVLPGCLRLTWFPPSTYTANDVPGKRHARRNELFSGSLGWAGAPGGPHEEVRRGRRPVGIGAHFETNRRARGLARRNPQQDAHAY